MIKKSVILILIISFFLSGIIILKSNFVIARNDNPSIYSIDLIPLKDKNAWFPEHKKTFTSKDKGVIIEVGWYKLKPKKYNFGIKTYRPDGDIDTLTMTHEVKEKELGDKGQFDWWWQYSFKEDNLLNYLGKWKVDFLLNGKKKGESNFIIQYRHEVLNEKKKSINYYYKIDLDIWLKEDLNNLSKDNLILFAKYIANNYLNYSDEKIIEIDVYETKEKSEKNLIFTFEKDKIKGIHRIVWKTNNKKYKFSKEKISKLKPRLKNNRINVDYEIKLKENLNYGRYNYHVVVNEKVSINELKKLARKITEKAKTEKNFSALSIWFYDYEEYLSVGLTLGKVNFAKNGKWENGISTENGNYDVMSYNYKFRKKNWDKQLTPFEVKVWSSWKDKFDKELDNTNSPSEEDITNDIADRFNISKEKVNKILDKQIRWTSMDLKN